MKLFDSKAYHLHHKRAKRAFHAHSFLFEHVGNELISRLKDFKKDFKNVLNLSPHPLPYPSSHYTTIEENLPFSEHSFDLILSSLQVHWVNNLPSFLKDVHRCLQEDGLFLGALWGGNTLVELRESLLQAELSLTGGTASRVAPMIHPSDAPRLLGKVGFFMPVVDTEIITVSYSSFLSLLKDLRAMGETNKLFDRPKTFTRRGLFEKAEKIYHNTYGSPHQTIPATFEVLYLTGWKCEKP